MRNIKTYYYVIVLVIIQSIVFFQWIFSNNLFTFWDIGVYTPITQSYLFEQVQSIYKVHTDFWALDITASNFPFLFIFWLLWKLWINFIRSSKIMLFWPIVFGVVINSFFFVKHFTKENFSAFFSSLFYSYGFYFLITLTGALYISFAYAFAPLFMLLFFKVIEEPNIKKGILLWFFASLLWFIEFRILYILLRICLLYFAYFLITKKISFKKLLQYITIFWFTWFILLLLNAFWIIPLFFQGQIVNNTLFDRGIFGNQYFDLWNAFSIMHPRWNRWEPAIFVKQVAPVFLAIIPLLVVLWLIKNKRNNVFLFFALTFLLWVFLTKQSAEPFSGFYFWMYKNFPWFNAFREASKFFIISALSFSILLWLFFKKNNFQKKFLHILLFWSFLVVIFSNICIVFYWKLWTMFIQRKYEKDIENLNEIFNIDPVFYRVLWLPHVNKFSDYDNKHPAVSLLSNYETIYSKFNSETNISLEKTFQNIISHPDFIKLLREQSVKYIILPRDLIWDDVLSSWKNPWLYINILDQKEGIKKIYEKNGNFIYEVENYLPRVTVKSKDIILESMLNDKILLRIKKIQKKHVLSFWDSFNIWWKLYLTTSDSLVPILSEKENINKKNSVWSTIDYIMNKYVLFQLWDFKYLREKPIFEETHHLVNDYANGRTLDAEYIKKNFPKDYYKENPDGSIDVNLTLYFKPQSYFYLWLGVSGLTFFWLIAWLLVDRRRQKNLVQQTSAWTKNLH